MIAQRSSNYLHLVPILEQIEKGLLTIIQSLAQLPSLFVSVTGPIAQTPDFQKGHLIAETYLGNCSTFHVFAQSPVTVT
jgi:hypothetical protein